MGRKKKNYLPFEEARQFMREQCIPSRTKFYEWIKVNQSKAIPVAPPRVYKIEWKGWNDFLGNNNVMMSVGENRKTYRPLNEAIVFVHKLQFSIQEEWFTYCKENKETMPKDIPARPDLIYKDWISWSHWLGNKPRQKAEAQLYAQESSTYYIFHEQIYPINVLTFSVIQGGRSAIKDKWEREKFDLIKMFKYRPEYQGVIEQILEVHSTPWYGDKYVRIVPNINQILWNLSTIMEVLY